METFVADTIFVDAAPEAVFAALLDADAILAWSDGAEARLEVEPGGEFFVAALDGAVRRGRVERVDAPRELAIAEYFEERDRSSLGPMRLSFALRPEGDGVWVDVRLEGIDVAPAWRSLIPRLHRDLVGVTLRLKRLVEGI